MSKKRSIPPEQEKYIDIPKDYRVNDFNSLWWFVMDEVISYWDKVPDE